ncbi:hypothetical protein [Ruminococcus flavefaciens]|uniref:hypothetical protein n=1 Tax=Ruminococcus flavefaciens TaxID=1265 RepID=UPI000491CDBB|nr:hypothetical protein [Ruminococcus flavefaciens]
MSEKTDFFDEIIDEKTVEKISEDYPVLSDEEKDRIFSIVERKLNIDKAVNNDHSGEVSGVEEYTRPRFMNIISIAASAAVLFGGIGSSLCLMRNMKKGAPDDPAPEIVTESVIPSSEKSVVSDETRKTAENQNNYPVPKATKAVEDHLAETDAKDNTAKTPAVAAVSMKNDEAAEQDITSAFIADTTEAETNEPHEDIQTDTAVTTAVTAVSRESIQTTAVQSTDDYEKLVDTAECLIADYDAIRNITDVKLPVIEGSTITVTHKMATPSGDGVFNRLLEYGQVDPDVYPDIQTLKERFYSVMCSSIIESDVFGDEFSSGSSPEGIVVDHAYSYITYDGKLYRLLGREKHELEPLPYEKAIVYNVSECAFTAEKNYIDLTDGSTVTVKYGVVRDFKANKWSLLNVTSD